MGKNNKRSPLDYIEMRNRKIALSLTWSNDRTRIGC